MRENTKERKSGIKKRKGREIQEWRGEEKKRKEEKRKKKKMKRERRILIYILA